MSTVPMAASGIPAPVTLVEVARRSTTATTSGSSLPAGVTPPPPPRALAAGESISWAIATRFSSYVLGSGGPVIGTASGTVCTATIEMSAGDPLGQNGYGILWENFVLPGDIPPGSIIVAIIPAFTANGNSGSMGLSGQNRTSSGPISGDAYGIGGNSLYSLPSLAGASLYAQLFNTLPGSASLSLDVAFAGFAIIYTAGVAPPETTPGLYFWSEHDAKWPSFITGEVERFLPWLDEPVELELFGSVQTDTARISIQNISGNTVERDAALAFTRTELIGALVAIRIWDGAAETALLTFIGNVKDAEIDDTSLVLSVEGLGNWSAVAAPSYDIDAACPLTFASPACGSTSATPCDQTFGTCSQVNRFAGVLAQWISEAPDVQLAQPVPVNNYNTRRPF